jgi:type II secretory pathway pseudopilin PulG
VRAAACPAGGIDLAFSVVFLTPFAALVVLAAVLPLAALALAARRVRRTRAALRLPAPPRTSALPGTLAVIGVVGLLAVAAAQPAIRSRTTAKLRTDAQAMFVIDVSRSMSAAGSAHGRTRLQRAKREAVALRAAIPQVASGVATLTDRTLPSLLPSPRLDVFDQTVDHAVAIGQPPPQDENVVATSLEALGALGTQNYFPASAKRRLAVVLTDGESRPFDPRRVARALGSGPGVHVVLVHVSKRGERVYDGGRPEAGYHEDPASAAALSSLAQAAGGEAFGEDQLGAAARTEQAALGSGPTIQVGTTTTTHTIAPYVALGALLPLLVVIGPRRLRRGVRRGAEPEESRQSLTVNVPTIPREA